MPHPTKKKLYFDVMRAFAVFFVVFIHVGDAFGAYKSFPPFDIKLWICLCVSLFSKFAVPLFLMISGALLLNREPEKLSVLFKKRILRMVIVLVAISLIYYVYYLIYSKTQFDFRVFLPRFYAGGLRTHLWYLYAYIAFLISLPFLQNMVKKLDNKYFYLMFAVAFAIKLVPCFEMLLFNNRYTMMTQLKPLWMVSTILLYPCVGYFVEHRMKLTKRTVIVSSVVATVLIVFSAILTVLSAGKSGVYPETYFDTFSIVTAFAVYVIIKSIFKNVEYKGFGGKLISSLGDCAFGIYLFHLLFHISEITKFKSTVVTFLRSMLHSTMISAVIWCFIVFIISYIFVWLIRKIPIVKKFI